MGKGVESKQGELLYLALCYACHGDPGSLGNQESRVLSGVISHGVPGTSMPGFSLPDGGPLSRTQIVSLVEFINKKSPRARN